MKVKMIHAPMETINNEFRLLPLGMSLVTTFLRQNGIKVDQDDLDVKIRSDNKKEKILNRKINVHAFDDEVRVKKYISDENHDIYIDFQLERILKKIDLKGIDLVGFSLTFGRPFLNIALFKKIKEIYDLPIAVGGPFVNFIKERIIENFPFIDYAVLGNGEKPLLQLCKLIDGDRIHEKDILGLLYSRNGTMKYNRGNEDAHGNYQLIPDYDGLPIDLFRYNIPDILREVGCEANADEMPLGKKFEILVIPFQFIMGCPHKCAFCTASIFDSFNFMPVDKVADSISHLSKKYKTKYFLFLNCEINTDQAFLDKLIQELIKRDLHILWSDSARLENLNKKRLDNLREAGCVRLWYGIESASQKVLDFVGKNINVKKAERILKLSHDSQIWNGLNFIFGLPNEKTEDIDETLAFIKRNKKFIDCYALNRFYLNGLIRRYPGRYGFTNIRFHETLKEGFASYAFDEIGGLPYEERLKRCNEAIAKANGLIGDRHENITSDIRFLFYFYSTFEGNNVKNEIYSLLHQKLP